MKYERGGTKVLVAVVTGASRGLGRHIAFALGKAGYNVAVNYYRSESEAKEVALKSGIQALSIKADVGNPEEVKHMAEKVYGQWGRIDALINNAGITRDGLMLRYREDDWDEVIRVNLKGCFNMVKSFAPLMIESGGGHIINIASYSGMRGKTGQAAYSASKASLIGLTFSLAKELAAYHIRVNSVLPGYLDEGMGIKTTGAMEKAKRDSIVSSLSKPEETAGFIAYLLRTVNVTGQVFSMDSRI